MNAHQVFRSDATDLQQRSILLQRIIIDRPQYICELYWKFHDAVVGGASGAVDRRPGHLHLNPHTVVSFDTYFNAFFEATWRNHTCVDGITLKLDVDGPCTVRVKRTTGSGTRILCEHVLSTGKGIAITLADEGLHFRQYGLLSFELTTGDLEADFHGGAWFAEAVEAPAVRLSAVICTFNREPDIARILERIAADPVVSECLTRVFVINQGSSDVSAAISSELVTSRIGSKLRVVDQTNFGGAGGFSRGLLEAIADAETTHVVLLDDDIVLEPDSIVRMAAFFALSKADVIVGGQMLDSMAPTTLYEAGAVVSDRHWAFQPQHNGRRLTDANVLVKLSEPTAVHYNGWWCCGMPLSVVRRHGMPLPCFIRGDDMEYGLRLHQAGIVTVAVPGIAVWHEPFYLKTGGWHLYYETRNVLIAASLHQPMRPQEVARRMARQLAMSLLTFRYYDAALVLEGIRDFLAGPDFLKAPPQARHASLELIRKRYPASVTTRHVVLEKQVLTASPRSTFGFIAVLGWLLAKNAILASHPAPPRFLPVNDFAWPRMRGVEHVAVETWWDKALPTFHRSRKDFRVLALGSLRTLWQLYRRTPALVKQWQAALPSLTSEPFWRRYLGLERPHHGSWASNTSSLRLDKGVRPQHAATSEINAD